MLSTARFVSVIFDLLHDAALSLALGHVYGHADLSSMSGSGFGLVGCLSLRFGVEVVVDVEVCG